MKKLSSRAVTALTNAALALVLIVMGAVCFLPAAKEASSVNEKVYYRGSSEDGVSLMINVYWGTEEVYSILDILDEYAATATFFIGGSWADDNTDCVKEIAARGHEIGSHGYFHRDHDKLSLQQNSEEIETSVRYLNLVTGGEVKLFAPPSGAYNDDTVLAAEQFGLKVVMWSRDTVDWRDKDENVCYRRATENVSGGELILMHPMPHTVKALPRILEYYQANALRTVSVGENLGT